ncbi:MAG: MFS transporter [Candidatus Bilamarchaeaceae archaeon]
MLRGKEQLLRLLLLYSLWVGANVFSGSLLYLYFKHAGMSNFDLLASFIFWPAAAIFLVLLLNKRMEGDHRFYMGIAIFLMALSYIALALLPPTKELLFFSTFILGLTCLLFWVPFNIMYFEQGVEQAATSSSIYFSMSPFLGLLLPVASAVVAEVFGFQILFILSALLFLIIFLELKAIKKRGYSYSAADGIKEIKGFRTLIFTEGVYGGGTTAAITIVTLLFFTKPLELGGFIAITTIFSIIASFFVSKLSDKVRKRRVYIILFGSALGLITIFTGFASNAALWFTANAGRNFFINLFNPFTTAILLDNKRDIDKVMLARELILNIGRLVGIVLVLCLYILFSNMFIPFVVLGLLILTYPFIVWLKGKKHIHVE